MTEKHKRLNSPVVWFGGKGNMKAKILPILESVTHDFYAEPFGGGASILIAKQPVKVETYNDIDNGLYDFFRVISDPDLFCQFERRVSALPYHRRMYNEARANWQDCDDLIQRVTQWFIVARQSFGGGFGTSFGTAVTASWRGRAGIVSNWQSAIDRLPEIHARLQRVQIESVDWRDIIRRYDTPKTLFYCDPPYIASTRKSGGYAHELDDQDHRDLVDALLAIEGKAALSGYDSDLYRPLEAAGWYKYTWHTISYAAGKTHNSNLQGEGAAMKNAGRVECLWTSWQPEQQLSLEL